MNSVEDAYQAIASYLLAFVGDRRWDKVEGVFRTYSKMASGRQWLTKDGLADEYGGFDDRHDAMWAGLDAALYLRDDLLKKTGDRIWGLTFTLYPDGKFRIEYDYNKPADYEETDETIEVDFNKDVPGTQKE